MFGRGLLRRGLLRAAPAARGLSQAAPRAAPRALVARKLEVLDDSGRHGTARHRNVVPDNDFAGMEVVFLGTGAGGPSVWRSASSVALKLDGETWIFDCGEGTYRQIMCSKLSFSAITKVFITHMHGDHIWGLISLLVSNTAITTENEEFKEINIYGPQGIHRYVLGMINLSECNLPKQARVVVHEMLGLNEKVREYPACHSKIDRKLIKAEADGSWKVCETDQYRVSAAGIRHTCPCIGFVVDEFHKKLKIDAAKASEMGLRPCPEYRFLQHGMDVTLEDGRQIRAADVTFKPRRPRRVVIVGDTSDPPSPASRKTSHGSGLIPIARHPRPDLVIHEATASNELRDFAMRTGHSTPAMAGRFAKSLGARSLVLTHLSPRFFQATPNNRRTRPDDDGNFTSTDVLVDQAREAFGSDSVLAAHDFMTLALPAGGLVEAGEDDDYVYVPPEISGRGMPPPGEPVVAGSQRRPRQTRGPHVDPPALDILK